jgi:hypothetical protein
MCTRDCSGVIQKNRCYIRKPQTGEKWRLLIDRRVRANRGSLLDAIRTIVTGEVLPNGTSIGDASTQIESFSNSSRSR